MCGGFASMPWLVFNWTDRWWCHVILCPSNWLKVLLSMLCYFRCRWELLFLSIWLPIQLIIHLHAWSSYTCSGISDGGASFMFSICNGSQINKDYEPNYVMSMTLGVLLIEHLSCQDSWKVGKSWRILCSLLLWSNACLSWAWTFRGGYWNWAYSACVQFSFKETN